MLQSLKDLFGAFTAPAEAPPQARTRALQLAMTVLLVEVMRVDPATKPAERSAVLENLREWFPLADDALAQLMGRAEQTAKTASDYFQFTSCINDNLPHDRKIRLIESMWRIAYASHEVDPNENHLIGKIAELLYVTQGEYIGAKMRAKENAGLI